MGDSTSASVRDRELEKIYTVERQTDIPGVRA